jgi:phosphate butyryltransferase
MPGMRRNRTFDEIAVGDTAEASRKLTADDLVVFAHASGNLNPIHMPGAADAAAGEQEVVAPSAWVGALISCVLEWSCRVPARSIAPRRSPSTAACISPTS